MISDSDFLQQQVNEVENVVESLIREYLGNTTFPDERCDWSREHEKCTELNDVNFECLELFLNQIRLRRTWFFFGVDVRLNEHLVYKYNKVLIQYTPNRAHAKYGSILIYSDNMTSRDVLYEILYFQNKFIPNENYEMFPTLNHYAMDYNQAKLLFEFSLYN